MTQLEDKLLQNILLSLYFTVAIILNLQLFSAKFLILSMMLFHFQRLTVE